MGVYGVPFNGGCRCGGLELTPQLEDPHARSFTHIELREAMMKTIKFINKLSKDAGIVR
jgi:hypothetical protein